MLRGLVSQRHRRIVGTTNRDSPGTLLSDLSDTHLPAHSRNTTTMIVSIRTILEGGEGRKGGFISFRSHSISLRKAAHFPLFPAL